MAKHVKLKFCMVCIIFIFTVKTCVNGSSEAMSTDNKPESDFKLQTENIGDAGRNVQAEGVNVSLSAIFQQENCKSLALTHYLTIFAEDTFILDVDVTARQTLKSLVVFAKTWRVTGGYRKISLNGKPGKTELSAGMNGSPGGPGENGGFFLGIFKELHGARLLHIDVSGGNGGNGQHGKNGMKGDDGSPGKPGKPGKAGGDGGAGGFPGKPGFVFFFGLNDDFKNVTITNNTGELGKPGEGGKGGGGGAGGKPVLIKKCPIYGGKFSVCRKREGPPGTPGINGMDGEVGAFYIGQKFPEPISIPFDTWSHQVSEYWSTLLKSKSNDSLIFAKYFYSDSLLSSNIITHLSFAEDFLSLERAHFNHVHHINYTQDFEALLNRMQRFLELNANKVRQHWPTRQSLEYLRSAVLTKLSLLQQHSSGMITDVLKYADAIANDLRDIEYLKRNFEILIQKSAFTENIQKQSDSVKMTIENIIVPEINRLGAKFQQLLNEATEEMLHSFQHNKNVLEEKVIKYRDARLTRLLLDLVANGISFIFPCTKAATSIARRSGAKNSDPPPSVPFYTASLNLSKNYTLEVRSQMLKYELSELILYLRNIGHENLKILGNASLKAESILNTEKSSFNISVVRKILVEALDYEIQMPHTSQVLQTLRNYKSEFTWIFLTSALHDSSNLPENLPYENQNIFMLDAIKAAEKDILEAEIAIIKFQNDVKTFMESSFRIAITETLPFKAQNILRKLKHHVTHLLKGLNVEGELLVVIENLKNTIAQTQQLNMNLQALQDKVQIIDFISNISMWKPLLEGVGDDRVLKKVTEINLYIHLSLAREEHRNILQSCRLQVFPYANRLHATNCGHETSHFHTFDSKNSSEPIIERVSHIIGKIENIAQCMRKEEATILKGDSTLIKKEFLAHPGSQPFCTWHHSIWSNSIETLMRGDVVSLKCNISLHLSKSAVKFKKINLNLKCQNESQQIALSRDLAHFQVIMTHSGQNMFRVGPNLFRIDSERSGMLTCFQQTSTALKTSPHHCVENVLKAKLDSVNFMLSPFTYWEFEIIDAEPKNGLSIVDLEKHYTLCGGIDLELEGEGVYIADELLPRHAIEHMRLEKYYHPYLVATK